MEMVEQRVRMRDGHEVCVKTYMPAGDIAGHMHILHGMAEHSGRYDAFAREFAQLGYFISMHDHRGHGQTAEYNGELGFFAEQDGFSLIVEDAKEVIEYIRQQHELPELVLLGHSMGSFVARRYMQLYSHTVHKVILSGTGCYALSHAAGYPLAKVLAGVQGKHAPSQLLNNMGFASYNKSVIQPDTAFDWLTRDAQAVQQYIEDPQCGFVASHQFFVDVMSGLRIISNRAEMARIRPDLPVLLISGTADPVGNYGHGVYKVARQLQKAGVENIKVYLFEEMRHEILNELNKKQVYEVIKRWLIND